VTEAKQPEASDQRRVAKALSTVERGGAEAEALLRGLRGRSGRAWTVGITGAPAVGKSTLVQRLGLELLDAHESVAVLAIDPSSPFTGGALLGDRIRMPELVARGGFVRSMATRGSLGGLAAAASDAVDVLDAAGFSWVLVETVGVGQDEVEVASEVDTVVLVTTAALGDDVQAAKAGVMEIGQVFAVNKADLPGYEGQVAAVEAMLAMAPARDWRPPVVAVSAAAGSGITELAEAIRRHQAFLDTGERRQELRLRRARRRVERVLKALVLEQLTAGHGKSYGALLADVEAARLDPYTAARGLLGRFWEKG
jgi:LAO/AO transport system kinase